MGRIVQHGVGQQPFEARVLALQRLQPLGLRDVHPAELRFPFVDTGVADAMLAAQIGDRNAGLVLLQNPDDLFFRKTTALHPLVLVVGQSELQPGLSQRGNVTWRAPPNCSGNRRGAQTKKRRLPEETAFFSIATRKEELLCPWQAWQRPTLPGLEP